MDEDEKEPRAAVLAASEAYGETVRRADADAVAGFWTEDAVMWPPDGPDLHGRDEILALLRAAYPQVTVEEMVVRDREIEPLGGAVIELATYSERLRVGDEAPQEVRGRYVFVWKRQGDGSWKIHRGIYNSSSGGFRHEDVIDDGGN